jgi:acyl-coenzyme A thioesterase PaaI-like protein
MDAFRDAAIRNRVLTALGEKRASSFSFLGHFLALEWSEIGPYALVQTMPAGPHCTDAEDRVSLSALCGMVDIGLASACRLRTGPGGRLATVQLHLQFTGAVPAGMLTIAAAFDGFSSGHALRQSFSHGVVSADGAPVCYARAAFVALPPPAGAQLGSFPWELGGTDETPLREEALDTRERAVLDDCDRALASNPRDGRGFLERFLGLAPKPEAGGARADVAISPTLSNRVGDVQGGLLLGMAATTAVAATPEHPGLSTLSASFVGPGRGEVLRIGARILHAGRSLATVRTEIRSSAGALLLDAVSSHTA